MAVLWNSFLETGIKVIDEQHKELFRRIDKVYASSKEGKSKEELGKIIIFLQEYVIKHFDEEQQIMLKNNYPEYEQHKKLHEKYIIDVENLKQNFNNKDVNIVFILETNRFLSEWLVNHINKVDKKLATFLKASVK